MIIAIHDSHDERGDGTLFLIAASPEAYKELGKGQRYWRRKRMGSDYLVWGSCWCGIRKTLSALIKRQVKPALDRTHPIEIGAVSRNTPSLFRPPRARFSRSCFAFPLYTFPFDFRTTFSRSNPCSVTQSSANRRTHRCINQSLVGAIETLSAAQKQTRSANPRLQFRPRNHQQRFPPLATPRRSLNRVAQTPSSALGLLPRQAR